MTDSGSARRDESNDMCFEAGRRFVPEIALRMRTATKHISFDSSRRVEQESVNCA